MSGSLQVTWQELSSAATKIKSGKGEITTKLGELKSLVDNLGGTWQGAASGAYANLYQNWNQGASQLFESLEGIASMLSQAANAYEQTETQLKSGFSG